MRMNLCKVRIGIVDGERVMSLASAIFVIISTLFLGHFISKNKDMDITYLKFFFCQTIPMSQDYINPKIEVGISPSKLFLGFDISDPLSIITNQIAVVSAANKYSEDEAEHFEVLPQPTPTASSGPSGQARKIEEIMVNPQGSKGYISADGVYVKNNTTYDIDVNKLINENLSFKFEKGKPQVLIVHTHASESFTPSDKDYYEPTDPDRTEDINFNIVRVGAEMAKALNDMGVKTLHDTTLHDYPSYNGSYKNCLATVQKYLSEYPSIKVVLDIHRDGMTTSDGTKLKVCTTLEGKKTAQVMIVCGTNNSGLEHPNWRENLKLALRMQAKMNELYPSLTRPISLVKERYNMHTSNGSLLLEVGSNGNTLEEAINGGRCAAVSIGELLKSLK